MRAQLFRPHAAAVTRELVCGGFSALVTAAVMIARRHDIAVSEKMLPDLQLSLSEPLIRPLVPTPLRGLTDIVWRLDERLWSLSRAGKEPALRQIRLAWWRDALAALDATDARVPDEPLLRDIAANLLPTVSGTTLAAFADARLAALGSDWANDVVIAAGRRLFDLTRQILTGDLSTSGGACHALVSAALAMDDSDLRQKLLKAASEVPPTADQPRALAVLDQLARSIARRDGQRRRGREQALILRVGLFGR
jgi:15-cis-phytoene synthase